MLSPVSCRQSRQHQVGEAGSWWGRNLQMCPGLVCDKPVHVWCVWMQGEGTSGEFRSDTTEMCRLDKYYSHATLRNPEKGKRCEFGLRWRASYQAPLCLNVQGSAAWGKRLEGRVCDVCSSQDLLLGRCLCGITSLWDQTWLSLSACSMVSGCCLTALKMLKCCMKIFAFFLVLLERMKSFNVISAIVI